MRSSNPRKLYESIAQRRKTPDTELERSLFVALHGASELNKLTVHRPWDDDQMIDPSLTYPLGVFRTDETRPVMEAFLLATEEDHEVGQALGMNIDEVSIYRSLFFDTSVFRTDLEIIVFMQNISEEDPYKKMYKIAFHQGIGALRWHFCRDKGEVAAEKVIKTVMTDAYYRSLEHRGMPITSKVAKEAARLAKLSLDCAKLITENEVHEGDDKDLSFKFEQVRKNRSVEDLKQDTGTSEVLH